MRRWRNAASLGELLLYFSFLSFSSPFSFFLFPLHYAPNSAREKSSELFDFKFTGRLFYLAPLLFPSPLFFPLFFFLSGAGRRRRRVGFFKGLKEQAGASGSGRVSIRPFFPSLFFFFSSFSFEQIFAVQPTLCQHRQPAKCSRWDCLPPPLPFLFPSPPPERRKRRREK